MEKAKQLAKNDDELLSAEVLAFAQDYQATDFPNPARQNCLPNSELLKIARSDNLPDKIWRQHLLSCSPCFCAFQTARQAKLAAPTVNSSPTTAAKSNRFHFFLRPFPIAIGIIFVLSFIVVIFFAVLNNPNSETVSQIVLLENQNSLLTRIENPTDSNLPTKLPFENRKKASGTKIEGKSAVTNIKDKPKVVEDRHIFKLDFSQTAILRNQADTNKSMINLPAKDVRFNIKLPQHSPAGIYHISLLDEFGKPLVKALTKQSNGKILAIDFDLKRLSRQNARMCVALKTEVPDCLAVKIENARQ